LLNNIGSVIGITSFTLVDGQNLNFAHPAYYIKKLLLSSPPGYLTWDRIPANDKTLGLLIVLDAEKFSFDHPNISNTFNDADFVRIVFMRHGISLPKLAKDQAAIGYDVPHDVAAGDASQWSRGDRLYFALHHPFIDHTGIYIGQGQFMHITENPANHGITVDKLTDSYYATHLVAVRRSQELLAEPVAP
jgi:cell wall-associated NlpC family hydrolase